MAEFPAMMLWTDAYLADTRHLTQAEHGGYLLLLMTAWRSPGCSLPDDDTTLARYAACDPRNWKKQRVRILEHFFTKLENGRWVQKRLLKEREHLRVVSQKRRAAVAVRFSKSASAEPGLASANLKANQLENLDSGHTIVGSFDDTNDMLTTPTPISKKEEPPNPLANGADHSGKPEPSPPPAAASVKPAKSARLPEELPEPFLRLWNAYPLRQQDRNSKLDVFKRWKADAEGQDHEAIIAAAKAYARTNGSDDYRLGLKTWLRNQTWLEPQTTTGLTGAQSRDQASRLVGMDYVAALAAGKI